MNRLITILIIGLCSCKSTPKHSDIETGWKNMEVILSTIKAPVFPDRVFNILDFGATSNGALCTEAFKQAIVACNKVGGGLVLVPVGDFISGTIHLLSNVELHLVEGATIKFSTNTKDYLPVVRTRFEGSELYNYSPLIYAYQQENIAITGKGIIDGQASIENWWSWKDGDKDKLNSQDEPNSVSRLLKMMMDGVPIQDRVFGDGYFLRSSFVQPYECKNILIEGVTIKRPPMWMIHSVLSENITIRNVKLFSKGSPYGDGCDPEASKNILIQGCEFSTGDDCIAIKSGRNRQDYNLGIPSKTSL